MEDGSLRNHAKTAKAHQICRIKNIKFNIINDLDQLVLVGRFW